MLSQRTLVRGAVLGLLTLLLGNSAASAQNVQWRPDYGAARREAAETQRPVVLVFSAGYCPYCRQLEATTLRDPEVVGRLNGQFVPLTVAGDDPANAYLVSGLRVQAYPSIVTISPKGKILESQEGYVDAQSFLALLNRASPAAEKTTAREKTPRTRRQAQGNPD